MKKYYPILVSKNGETGALQHLEQRVKDGVCPIIEILNPTLVKIKKDKNTGLEVESYSDKFEIFLKTHWNFFNNQVILDFSMFTDWERHIRFIEQTLLRLLNSGVNVVPCVQSNSTEIYKRIVTEIVKKYGCSLCFRFSNSSGGFLHMNSEIKKMISDYSVKVDNVILLADLGQIQPNNYNTIGSTLGVVLINLSQEIERFKAVVLASSSFPATLNDFDHRKEPHTLARYEWALFNNIAKDSLAALKYGDYGTKTANFEDVQYMGSISLKYSTDKEYVIYRGLRTIDHPLGHNQFIQHSRELVQSSYYSSSNFSWGDFRYSQISLQDLTTGSPGNSTQWVQYSQNHHITLMHSIL
ncbi:MAG: beta family protein [Ignavibacteriae bacterium]|nr:beta family protein [Ignavibacteriota bacterium]